MKTARPILIAAALVLALTGCVVHANLTVPASDVAAQAAKLLQKQVGSTTAPTVDCGKGGVDLVAGTKVDSSVPTVPASQIDDLAATSIEQSSGERQRLPHQRADRRRAN